MQQPDVDSTIPSPYYRVSLKAIIKDSKERLLVIQKEDGCWELPGGGWEHDESMQHCLRRETMEEIGVGISHIDFATMFPYSSKDHTGRMRLKLAIPAIADDFDFKLRVGIKAYKFVTAQELAVLNMLDEEVGIKNHIPRIWPIG